MDIDVDSETSSNAEKLQRALAYLGENWVLHKNYKSNPKHSPEGWCNPGTQQSK